MSVTIHKNPPGLIPGLGWPTCAVCNAPVEQVEYHRDDWRALDVFVVTCHGATERVEVDLALILRARHFEVAFGDAFVPVSAVPLLDRVKQ